jgi:hypothetical protein
MTAIVVLFFLFAIPLYCFVRSIKASRAFPDGMDNQKPIGHDIDKALPVRNSNIGIGYKCGKVGNDNTAVGYPAGYLSR